MTLLCVMLLVEEWKMLLIGQYQIAADILDHLWIRRLRWDAREVKSGSWIDQFLPQTYKEEVPRRLPSKPYQEKSKGTSI